MVRPEKHIKKFFMFAAGTVVILIGIIGCFLPVIPGVVLIIAGLSMMGKEAIVLDPVKKWWQKIKELKRK